MDEITAYLPGLSPVENKELCVRFDMSSDLVNKADMDKSYAE